MNLVKNETEMLLSRRAFLRSRGRAQRYILRHDYCEWHAAYRSNTISRTDVLIALSGLLYVTKMAFISHIITKRHPITRNAIQNVSQTENFQPSDKRCKYVLCFISPESMNLQIFRSTFDLRNRFAPERNALPRLKYACCIALAC